MNNKSNKPQHMPVHVSQAGVSGVRFWRNYVTTYSWIVFNQLFENKLLKGTDSLEWFWLTITLSSMCFPAP